MDECAIIVEYQRGDFGAIPREKIIGTPVLRLSRARKLRRIQFGPDNQSVDVFGTDGIRKAVQNEKRFCVKSRRDIRVAFSAQSDDSAESLSRNASGKLNRRFGLIVER